MATYSVSWTTSKITITVYGVKSGDNILAYYRLSTESNATTLSKTATSTSVSFEITGITANAQYVVNARDGSGSNLGAKTFTTSGSGSLPNFTIDAVTADSVTITVNGFIPNENVRYQVTQYSNSSKPVDITYYLNATTLTKTFTGLSPNTVYYADIQIANAFWIGGSAITAGKKFTTLAENARPSDWAWTSTIASGKPIRITAVEWNNFCARINEFRTYRGLTTYSFTTVSKGTTISATIVNQARTAISGITGHGSLPTVASKGSEMTASFFNMLKDALNAVT